MKKWKDIVVISGPPGLKQIKGFNDEPLKGERKEQKYIGKGINISSCCFGVSRLGRK